MEKMGFDPYDLALFTYFPQQQFSREQNEILNIIEQNRLYSPIVGHHAAKLFHCVAFIFIEATYCSVIRQHDNHTPNVICVIQIFTPLCYFVLVFFSPFSIAITLLGKERANVSASRTIDRFALVWFCLFPLPLGVWEGLRFVIVALPGLFSYFFLTIKQLKLDSDFVK